MTDGAPRVLDRLWEIVTRLRAEDGCPWDRKQTLHSMGRHLAGEVYELLDAISDGAATDICEESGDVLFQMVFILWIAEEEGLFTFETSMNGIAEKLIRRHPHVFGEEEIRTAEEVEIRWQAIKAEEKQGEVSLLGRIPKSQPALKRSHDVSKTAAAANFDWNDMDGVWEQVAEEVAEFKAALASVKDDAETREDPEMEFGDLLFTLTNVARFAGIDPEAALHRSVDKFSARWSWMERRLAETGDTPESVSRATMEALWKAAKEAEARELKPQGPEGRNR